MNFPLSFPYKEKVRLFVKEGGFAGDKENRIFGRPGFSCVGDP